MRVHPYSIQDSSLAGEACIWLGGDGEEGGRAHLTQADAAALIPLLQAFVHSGSITHEADVARTDNGQTRQQAEARPPSGAGVPAGWKLVRDILAEATVANEVIRLNRDGRGQGRIRVATAMHRIAKLAARALSASTTEAPGSEGAEWRKVADDLNAYTSHSIGCALYQQSWVSGAPRCSCGLDAARLALNEQGEG